MFYSTNKINIHNIVLIIIKVDCSKESEYKMYTIDSMANSRKLVKSGDSVEK